MEPEIKPGAKKPRSKTLRLVSVLLALSALLGGSTFYILRRGYARSVAQVQDEVSVLHLDPFVVNLADSDQRAYLRVGIDLGISATAQASKPAESAASTALIRDTLLDILMAARSDELATAEGKRKLKEQMLQTLNTRTPGLNVREIYFTEFLIQK